MSTRDESARGGKTGIFGGGFQASGLGGQRIRITVSANCVAILAHKTYLRYVWSGEDDQNKEETRYRQMSVMWQMIRL